jgi:SAM-dependent methyltransferase
MTKDERHTHVAKARLAASLRDYDKFVAHASAAAEGLTQVEADSDPVLIAALREFKWRERLLQLETTVEGYATMLMASQEPLKALTFLRECVPCGLESSPFISGIRQRLEAKVKHVESYEAYKAFYSRPVIIHAVGKSNRVAVTMEHCRTHRPVRVLCVGPNNAAMEVEMLDAVPDMTITFAELASDFGVLAGSLAAAYPGRVLSHPMTDTYDWCNSKDKFDLVTCFEVLEHVPDADAALSVLREATDKNGACLISVPDGPASFDRTIPSAERFEHVRAFSVETFVAALGKHFVSVEIAVGDGSLVATCRSTR